MFTSLLKIFFSKQSFRKVVFLATKIPLIALIKWPTNPLATRGSKTTGNLPLLIFLAPRFLIAHCAALVPKVLGFFRSSEYTARV